MSAIQHIASAREKHQYARKWLTVNLKRDLFVISGILTCIFFFLWFIIPIILFNDIIAGVWGVLIWAALSGTLFGLVYVLVTYLPILVDLKESESQMSTPLKNDEPEPIVPYNSDRRDVQPPEGTYHPSGYTAHM